MPFQTHESKAVFKLATLIWMSFLTPCVAQTQAEAPARVSTVVVRVYTLSGKPLEQLTTARSTVEHILQHAGIEVAWIDCRKENTGTDAAASRCGATFRPEEIALRIMAAHESSDGR